MISVVLPVYNGEKYLEQSIESILGQTYTGIELVIVNDCSTDHTKDIISRFAKKDSRIKVITNLTNQKLPKSLNIGFEQCNGEFFTWTSDDNIFLPNALEELHDTLINSSADLVFSRCENIDANGIKISETPDYQDLREINYNNIVLACFMYRRKVHEALRGYDVTKFLVEDYDFWLRAYRHFKFVFNPKILYQIRYHGENLGFKYYEEVHLGKVALLKENLRYVKDDEIIDRVNYEITRCYNELSNFYYKKLHNKKNKRNTIHYLEKQLLSKIFKILKL